ncbi:MAG: hypothetical protein R3D44_02045 [Hyphomicrobiaceae bacterium]
MTEPKIYWVEASLPGRLAVISRPRMAGHFLALKSAGVDVVVSMLEPAEAYDVGLSEEAAWCRSAGIEFVSLPVTDHGIPGTFEEVEDVVAVLAGHLRCGRGVAAHCFAGLGRSPLLVASVLIHHGWSDAEAVDAVSVARGSLVPEMDAQHRWLLDLAIRRGERGATAQ